MLDEKIYQEASTEFGTTIGVAHVVGYKTKKEHIEERTKASYQALSDNLDINDIICDSIYNNVYVEFQSRGKDSGIRSSKSDTWIFKIVSTGDRHMFSIHIPLSRLKRLVSKDYRVVPGGDKLTSKGYLVPLTDLVKV